ncbi:hypothetical protein TIFTF001_009863 [Ficus carica]|uniref:Uncharacterized protein n=1 Tax=Ficus carica TaxID=3494 RepID=A0AA88D1N4_FICCA|nr:hypothetical protein TIFTF001_009863 [Ficus carica]
MRPNQIKDVGSVAVPSQITVRLQGTGPSNTPPTRTKPPLDGQPMLPLLRRLVTTDNHNVAGPTTLHHLILEFSTCHCTCHCSYSSASLHHLTKLAQYWPPAPVLTHALMSPHHPNSRARGIDLVEVKYLYT